MALMAVLLLLLSALSAAEGEGNALCYDDRQCDPCYECNDQRTRCVPIDNCYVTCYSDVDCGRSQFCSAALICEEQTTTCYDNLECRVPQICDLSIYKCVDPTTTTSAPGCCAGTSSSAYSRCTVAVNEEHCSRMSSCFWVSGSEADCSWNTSSVPTDPGCCMVVDETASDSRWFDHCISFHAEDDCLRPQNADGFARCQWVATPDDYDCSLLWPTPEPEQGCCAGSNSYSASMCNAVSVEQECNGMASCHWIGDQYAV